jgi:hydroxyacylglutathione hydrolase
VLGYERRFNPALSEALAGNEDEFVSHILSGQPEPPLYFARMKRDNRLGPALLPDGGLPVPKRITAADLGDWIGQAAILDLRSDRSAFAKNHLRGSLFAPMEGGNLPVAAGSYVDEDSRILLLVREESQVDDAVRQLIRIGLDRVEGWIPAEEALADSRFTAGYPVIGAEDLPANVTVLDVRGADEFAAAHVKGATHIAYTRLAARPGDLPEGGPLYVHCASGLRAALAASYLASRGREVVQVDGAFARIPAALKA